jgi:plastocyanin
MKKRESGNRDIIAATRGRAGLAGLAVTAALAMGACGHRQPLVVVTAPEGKAVVDMKASDYKFTPNNLGARAGDSLEFRIENVSGKNHNFTIKNPKGDTIRSVALPAHQAVTFTLDLPVEGTYHFYCDIDLHSALGMKGWITVKK